MSVAFWIRQQYLSCS